MPKCTILVGVPGSGKSTWLQQQNVDRGVVASTDNVIQYLGDHFGFEYNEIFSETIRFADMVMVRRMIYNAECGRDIYVDRTNMSEKSRRQFINKLKKYGYEFECVVFPTPEPEEWQRRLNSRPGKTIPQEAIDRMVNSYEIPLESEGFSKITVIK